MENFHQLLGFGMISSVSTIFKEMQPALRICPTLLFK